MYTVSTAQVVGKECVDCVKITSEPSWGQGKKRMKGNWGVFIAVNEERHYDRGAEEQSESIPERGNKRHIAAVRSNQRPRSPAAPAVATASTN